MDRILRRSDDGYDGDDGLMIERAWQSHVNSCISSTCARMYNLLIKCLRVEYLFMLFLFLGLRVDLVHDAAMRNSKCYYDL